MPVTVTGRSRRVRLVQPGQGVLLDLVPGDPLGRVPALGAESQDARLRVVQRAVAAAAGDPGADDLAGVGARQRVGVGGGHGSDRTGGPGVKGSVHGQ